MKTAMVLGFMLMGVATGACADIYKCVVGGQILYSDSKCGRDAKKVELVPETVDQDNGAALKQQSEKINQSINSKLKSPARAAKVDERRLAWLRNEAVEIQKQMDAELEPIRVHLRNLEPNHELKHELQARIDAITATYQVRLKENQDLIDKLNTDR